MSKIAFSCFEITRTLGAFLAVSQQVDDQSL